MTRAGQPVGDGRGGGGLPGGEILPDDPVIVPELGGPIGECRPGRVVLVAEEVVVDHFARILRGLGLERAAEGDGIQALPNALLIDQPQDLRSPERALGGLRAAGKLDRQGIRRARCGAGVTPDNHGGRPGPGVAGPGCRAPSPGGW